MRTSVLLRTAVIAGAVLSAGALYTRVRTARFNRRRPPRGRFAAAGGVSLHVLEAGAGDPVLLLHGNATTAEDWRASGVFGALAARRRVLAPDRPGYGASARPHDRVWTLKAQADALAELLRSENAAPAVVVAHSLATQIALHLAHDHPDVVRGLVLVSGYYYPRFRADAVAAGLAATPGLGDVYRHTLGAPVADLVAGPAVKTMFAPFAKPRRYRRAVFAANARPLQLRAANADGAYMPISAALNAMRVGDQTTPIAILAGGSDEVVSAEKQSRRLAEALPDATMTIVPGAGHMVHHEAIGTILAAVESVSAARAVASVGRAASPVEMKIREKSAASAGAA